MDTTTKATIGKRIKSWRKSKQLRLVDLSEMIEVSQGSLSDLENNKSQPSYETLRRLNTKAGIDLYWLFGIEKKKSKDQSKEILKNLLPGEPFFLLRAQDRISKVVVQVWISIAEYLGVAERKIEGAREIYKKMKKWPGQRNPD